MYLSQLRLKPGRTTSTWMLNPYQVHQRVKLALPDDPRVLYRVEGRDVVSILVQSTEQRPDWETAFRDLAIVDAYQVRTYQPRFVAGSRLAFRLRANPTVCREGVRRPLTHEPDQHVWLERKLETAGAEVVFSDIVARTRQIGWKGTVDNRLTHLAVTFEGVVQVVNPELLRRAVQQGIGAAKGLGFGLLSVAPVSAAFG